MCECVFMWDVFVCVYERDVTLAHIIEIFCMYEVLEMFGYNYKQMFMRQKCLKEPEPDCEAHVTGH